MYIQADVAGRGKCHDWGFALAPALPHLLVAPADALPHLLELQEDPRPQAQVS